MGRPRTSLFSLSKRLARIRDAGINEPLRESEEDDLNPLIPLQDRIPQILNILRRKPVKPTDMTCIIMYDIENNKVRREIAKYLISQGCIRIQKSVYLAMLKPEQFRSIFETLKEVQAYYENVDSILLVPVNVSDARSMKIIGKDIQVEAIVDPPNTLFF